MILLLMLLTTRQLDAERMMMERVMSLARSQGYAAAAAFVQDQYAQSPYDWGMTLAQNYPRSATTWFRGLYEIQKEERYRYGIAWCCWLDNNSLDAFKAAGVLTTSADVELRGHALGLMGLIYIKDGRHDAAIKCLWRAVILFEFRTQFGEVSRYGLPLARVLIDTQRFEEAHRLVELIRWAQARQSPPGPGEPYELLCLLALATGTYAEAVDWAEQLGQADDEGLAALGKAYLALSLALYGEVEAASQIAIEAERDASRPLRATGLLALAWARLTQCQGLASDVFMHDYWRWEVKSGDHLPPLLVATVGSEL